MRITSQTHLIACFLLGVTSDSFGLEQPPNESHRSLVVVISGFGSDASSEQLANRSLRGRGNSGMYQLAGDLKKDGLEARFFNWNGTSAGQFTQNDAPGTDGIVSFIREENSTKRLRHLVVIGHSWGGHTMMEVAQALMEDPRIEISLAIGVDPSSILRGERVKELPSIIRSFVNYHTRNAFVWGAWPDEERIHNIDLGDPSNGFAANNKRNYAARFDLNAHKSVEWDKRIHKDIVTRIKNVIGAPETHTPTAKRE